MKSKWLVIILTDRDEKHTVAVKTETAREAAKVAGRKISYIAPDCNITSMRVMRHAPRARTARSERPQC